VQRTVQRTSSRGAARSGSSGWHRSARMHIGVSRVGTDQHEAPSINQGLAITSTNGVPCSAEAGAKRKAPATKKYIYFVYPPPKHQAP
jgi:hypothetical protein